MSDATVSSPKLRKSIGRTITCEAQLKRDAPRGGLEEKSKPPPGLSLGSKPMFDKKDPCVWSAS